MKYVISYSGKVAVRLKIPELDFEEPIIDNWLTLPDMDHLDSDYIKTLENAVSQIAKIHNFNVNF